MSVYAGKNWHKLVYATDWHKLSLCRHFANPAYFILKVVLMGL